MIEAFLHEQRARVDQALERCLPPADAAPSRLHEAMRYAVFGGGKRLRPLCCLVAARSVGGDVDAAMPAACAVELLHTYSLVHDDLPCMDDDDLRRGRPTVHRAFDEATAVLVGDGLHTLAFEVIARDLPAPAAARCVAVLAHAAGSLGMVGGQAGDLEAEGRTLEHAEILAIDARKTAALFAASFAMGGICAGAGRDLSDRLGQVGHDIGVAFQIIDDLLDRNATAEQLGKATGKDRARGKATLPERIGEDAAFAEARRLTERARESAGGLPQPRLIGELIDRMLRRTS